MADAHWKSVAFPIGFIDDQVSSNVAERSFCLLEQWRGLATRYDKHAVTYRGAVVLAATVTWLH